MTDNRVTSTLQGAPAGVDNPGSDVGFVDGAAWLVGAPSADSILNKAIAVLETTHRVLCAANLKPN